MCRDECYIFICDLVNLEKSFEKYCVCSTILYIIIKLYILTEYNNIIIHINLMDISGLSNCRYGAKTATIICFLETRVTAFGTNDAQ